MIKTFYKHIDGHNSPPQDRIKSNHAVYVQESNVHSPGRTSEPMHLATPTNKIYSVNEHKGKHVRISYYLQVFACTNLFNLDILFSILW